MDGEGSDNSCSEGVLIARCRARQAGWESELAQWIRGSSGWLQRRCAVRLGSDFLAEDAVQEISIKVILAIDQFAGRCTLRTWVTRIADNHCHTLIQQQCARALTDHLQYSLRLTERGRFRSQSEIDRKDDRAQDVGETLRRLTEQNRQVLQLRFHLELSLADMASSLGLSLSATKMRLYRALDAFKSSHEEKNVID